MWEVTAFAVIRQRDGVWDGKAALEEKLADGWEPFAVTDHKDHFYGLLYHLRRKTEGMMNETRKAMAEQDSTWEKEHSFLPPESSPQDYSKYSVPQSETS